jgi:cell division initiation protein
VISATEVRNIKFNRSMSGYKQEEVDIFLDKIEADLANYERMLNEFQARNEALNKEIEDLKASQNSIQSVLLSAQQLADRIVSEAKEKSEEIIRNAETNISVITTREKELSATFELKAQERKSALENELNDMIKKAKLKADSITAAAEDSVARQQQLFDKLKVEVAAFKSGISAKYKEHLEILSSIPDSVPSDPTKIAELVSVEVDKAPDVSAFIKPEIIAEPVVEPVNDNNGFFIKEELPVLDEEDENADIE